MNNRKIYIVAKKYQLAELLIAKINFLYALFKKKAYHIIISFIKQIFIN